MGAPFLAFGDDLLTTTRPSFCALIVSVSDSRTRQRDLSGRQHKTGGKEQRGVMSAVGADNQDEVNSVSTENFITSLVHCPARCKPLQLTNQMKT